MSWIKRSSKWGPSGSKGKPHLENLLQGTVVLVLAQTQSIMFHFLVFLLFDFKIINILILNASKANLKQMFETSNYQEFQDRGPCPLCCWFWQDSTIVTIPLSPQHMKMF